jgi:methionyl-tRNA formyltransferase
MKLLLCTKNDLFGAVILNYLLPELRHHEIRVLLSDKARSGEDSIPELRAEKFLEREYPLEQFFVALDRERSGGAMAYLQRPRRSIRFSDRTGI